MHLLLLVDAGGDKIREGSRLKGVNIKMQFLRFESRMCFLSSSMTKYVFVKSAKQTTQLIQLTCIILVYLVIFIHADQQHSDDYHVGLILHTISNHPRRVNRM